MAACVLLLVRSGNARLRHTPTNAQAQAAIYLLLELALPLVCYSPLARNSLHSWLLDAGTARRLEPEPMSFVSREYLSGHER